MNSKYQKGLVRKFTKNVDKLLQFFDGQIAGNLLVTRDLLQYKYNQDVEFFSELERLWSDKFIKQSTKMMRENRSSPAIILKRCVMSVIASTTVRQHDATRKSVCILDIFSIFSIFSILSVLSILAFLALCIFGF